MAVYWFCATSINRLKRKELVGYSVEALERAGIVDTMPLDQRIGVRIPGGAANKTKTVIRPRFFRNASFLNKSS